MDRRTRQATVHGVNKELDMTEQLKLSLFSAFPLVNFWFVFLFALKVNSTVNFP